MNTLPAELRFPKPPFRIEQSLLDRPPPGETIAGYLEQVRRWRSEVLGFLTKSRSEGSPAPEGLSERARTALAAFLAVRWSEPANEYAARSFYNISAFPEQALRAEGCPSVDLVLDVLRWRAAIDDYLSDIWDVIGEPALNVDECMALQQFLHPAGGEELCAFCLTQFPPEQRHADWHACLLIQHVRAKWPDLPPAMKRWNEEARTSSRVAGPQAPPRKRFWQFWK